MLLIVLVMLIIVFVRYRMLSTLDTFLLGLFFSPGFCGNAESSHSCSWGHNNEITITILKS